MNKNATFTILGSGTSSGVPLIGCPCKVCRSKDSKNKRLRSSAWFQADGKSILIDTSADLRAQALKQKILRVDAVAYTHPHSDHISGIDELRAFNFLQRAPIPIYGSEWTISELKHRYAYIFSGRASEGGGIAKLIPHVLDPHAKAWDIEGFQFIPIPVPHGSKECVGFRIGDLAYVTDCNEIPELPRSRLQGLETLILDCVRLKPHATHLHLEGALSIIRDLKPRNAYLTHLGHDFEHSKFKQSLPRGVFPAYDGLKIMTTRAKLTGSSSQPDSK